MDRRRRELKPGTVLADQYKVGEQIGAGGFAITYKGVNIKNDVTVAIKEFFPMDRSVEMEHEKQRFIREAHILREFDYLEGIVSVRDVFEEGDTAYLVMDYIEGITLKDYVAEYGTFSWEELMKMVTPVMRSLTKIHRRNVTHCDISPDNLMIGMDNRLWLIDFGATQRANVRRERTVILKQGYAPIEQYYSDGSVVDGKIGAWTDVYAFAATMYMALTGEKPRTAVERMKSVKDPDTLQDEEWNALSGMLEEWQTAALMKGMAVQKAERYATMDEFLETISFPPDETDGFTRIVYREPVKKEKDARWILILLILLVFLLAGLVLYMWVYGRTAGTWKSPMKKTVTSQTMTGQQAGPEQTETGAGQQTGQEQTEIEAGSQTRQEGSESGSQIEQEQAKSGQQKESAGMQQSTSQQTEQSATQQSTSQRTEQSAAQQSTGQQTEQSAAQQSTGQQTEQSAAQKSDTQQNEQQTTRQSSAKTSTAQSTKEDNDWPDSDDDDDLY